MSGRKRRKVKMCDAETGEKADILLWKRKEKQRKRAKTHKEVTDARKH